MLQPSTKLGLPTGNQYGDKARHIKSHQLTTSFILGMSSSSCIIISTADACSVLGRRVNEYVTVFNLEIDQ